MDAVNCVILFLSTAVFGKQHKPPLLCSTALAAGDNRSFAVKDSLPPKVLDPTEVIVQSRESHAASLSGSCNVMHIYHCISKLPDK